MSDLHHSFAGLFVSRAHLFGVIDGKGHRLLLIHMFPGIERRDEMFAVKMLGCRNEDGINRFVFQKPAMVVVGSRCRNNFLRIFQPPAVDVGESDEINTGKRDGFTNELHPSIAGSNDTEADSIVGAKDSVGGGESGRKTGCNSSNKTTPGTHDSLYCILTRF